MEQRRSKARLGNGSCITDLPDDVLVNIMAGISDTRSRNSAALVCRKWLSLERATRRSLTLRGNAQDIFMLPTTFSSITHLDISLLSPWGHTLFSSGVGGLGAEILRRSFPAVTSLTLYSRDPSVLDLLSRIWPSLSEVKLVRWHPRPNVPAGSDFLPLFRDSTCLSSLDLSEFHHWAEDLPPVLQANPSSASKLTRLNLRTRSFSDGFRTAEIQTITAACRNLIELRIATVFDSRYYGHTSDEALLAIASNCGRLSVLHLDDVSSMLDARSNNQSVGEGGFSLPSLITLFSSLPLLEDLSLDVRNNVRNTAPAMAEMASMCVHLKSLKLGQFQGVCLAKASPLDGIALCRGLISLSIINSQDLTDMGLIAISRGCSRLAKFRVQGCEDITMNGLRTMACLLCSTLVEVKISSCKNLAAGPSLKAVEPLHRRLKRLHIDCIWDDNAAQQPNFYEDRKVMKWESLVSLSLWVEVGKELTPLPIAGMEDCPKLNDITIKIEGDCRCLGNPRNRFGLSCLSRYPLKKLQLNCSHTIGNALTAPSGQMDLSSWERFHLMGISKLDLEELQYWPPQDSDLNQRRLSLPAAGLLAQCSTLRKLVVHGTAHEHFMNFLLRIPRLRDAQFREDYYPATENDTDTDMRPDSCCRFEDALNTRRYLD